MFYKYVVNWIDNAGNTHTKQYATFKPAINKLFSVYSWFKNGECIEISSGKNIWEVVNFANNR